METILIEGFTPSELAAMDPALSATIRASHRAYTSRENSVRVANAQRWAAKALGKELPATRQERDELLRAFATLGLDDDAKILDRAAGHAALSVCEELCAAGWAPPLRRSTGPAPGPSAA